MMAIQAKRTVAATKDFPEQPRPAGMQAIDPALYQKIREALRELTQPRRPAGQDKRA
jgi:hypothetical protein